MALDTPINTKTLRDRTTGIEDIGLSRETIVYLRRLGITKANRLLNTMCTPAQFEGVQACVFNEIRDLLIGRNGSWADIPPQEENGQESTESYVDKRERKNREQATKIEATQPAVPTPSPNGRRSDLPKPTKKPKAQSSRRPKPAPIEIKVTEKPKTDPGPIWIAYKKDPTDTNLRNQLIDMYMPIVRYNGVRLCARLPDSIELDDMISVGVFGLMNAIDTFDLSRGVKFESYCVPRIRGAMLDELRKMNWVPRKARSQERQISEARIALQKTHGRSPTDAELARHMKMGDVEFEKMLLNTIPVNFISLNKKWYETDSEKDVREIDILEDKKGEDPTGPQKGRDLLSRITKGASREERLILILYYYEDLTMEEIGETLEISGSRVYQKHSSLMVRLATNCCAEPDTLFMENRMVSYFLDETDILAEELLIGHYDEDATARHTAIAKLCNCAHSRDPALSRVIENTLDLSKKEAVALRKTAKKSGESLLDSHEEAELDQLLQQFNGVENDYRSVLENIRWPLRLLPRMRVAMRIYHLQSLNNNVDTVLFRDHNVNLNILLECEKQFGPQVDPLIDQKS